jgi:hypothetical protein
VARDDSRIHVVLCGHEEGRYGSLSVVRIL